MTPDRARWMNGPISSERLALEPLTVAHAALLFDGLQDERIYAWISMPAPESVERLRLRFERLETRLSPSAHEAWLGWAVRRVGDGVYVGQIDVSVDDEHVATNVGYVFFPSSWGRGHATEAIGAVAAHLDRHGVVRQVALVTRGNLASARVLEKVGFVRTRILPDNDTLRGVPHDDLEYVRQWRPGGGPAGLRGSADPPA
jgi:[ribosomal protein S5]-alanine N-acetyltransferase